MCTYIHILYILHIFAFMQNSCIYIITYIYMHCIYRCYFVMLIDLYTHLHTSETYKDRWVHVVVALQSEKQRTCSIQKQAYLLMVHILIFLMVHPPSLMAKSGCLNQSRCLLVSHPFLSSV